MRSAAKRRIQACGAALFAVSGLASTAAYGSNAAQSPSPRPAAQSELQIALGSPATAAAVLRRADGSAVLRVDGSQARGDIRLLPGYRPKPDGFELEGPLDGQGPVGIRLIGEPAAVVLSAPAGQKGAAPSEEKAVPAAYSCRLRDSAGVLYCAPDPRDPVHARTPAWSWLAAEIDKGTRTLERIPAGSSAPAALYLAGDVELLRGAESGWLLPAVAFYERALRLYPEYPDAERARLNIALIHGQLGFVPELREIASRSGDNRQRLARALLAGLGPAAVPSIDGPGDGNVPEPVRGWLVACFATRTRVAEALDAGGYGVAGDELARIDEDCPPAFREHVDTNILRFRQRAMAGDAARASDGLLALIATSRGAARIRARETHARLMLEEGQLAEARRAFEALAEEQHPGSSRRAVLALARLDAREGRLPEGMSRLAALGVDEGRSARRTLMAAAAEKAIEEGDGTAALATVAVEEVGPHEIDASARSVVVVALLELGLHEHAEAWLGEGADRNLRGRLALARGNARAALGHALAAQPEEGVDPAADLLEARARVALRDDEGAEVALQRMPPAEAVAARIRLAGALRTVAPVRSFKLLRAGVESEVFAELPPVDARTLLAHAADSARLAGEDVFARASYMRFLELADEEPVGVGLLAGALESLPAPSERTEAWALLQGDSWQLARRLAVHALGVESLRARLEALAAPDQEGAG